MAVPGWAALDAGSCTAALEYLQSHHVTAAASSQKQRGANVYKTASTRGRFRQQGARCLHSWNGETSVDTVLWGTASTWSGCGGQSAWPRWSGGVRSLGTGVQPRTDHGTGALVIPGISALRARTLPPLGHRSEAHGKGGSGGGSPGASDGLGLQCGRQPRAAAHLAWE
jgi:hypothetical protein